MNGILQDLFVRSILIAALGLLCMWVIRKQSASTRHMVATSAIVGLLSLPFLKLLCPPFLLQWLPRQTSWAGRPLDLNPQIPPTLFPSHSLPTQVESPTINFWMVIWIAGTSVIAARHLYGWLTFQSWVREANPVEEAAFGSNIIESNRIKVPLTGWFGRSLIIVPSSWKEWSQDKKEYALLHELAHIRRRDLATQLLVRLACILFWPNPLVWFLAKQSRNLAERAADDQVLSHGVPATQYAQALLEIAREARATLPILSGVCVSMAKDCDVTRRIEMILSKNTRRGSVKPSSLVIAGLILSAFTTSICTVAFAQQPVPVAPQSVEHSSTEFLVSMCFVKPHLFLKDTGLVKHKSAKGARDQSLGSTANTFAFEIPGNSAKEISAKWQTRKMIASNPRIRTLSGMNAEIHIATNDEDTSISVLPKMNKDHTIDISMTYQVKSHGIESNHQITYRSSSGATLLITGSGKHGGPSEVIGLLSVNVVDSD